MSLPSTLHGRTPEPPEVIAVHDHRVACDGGGGALGHPRVYLEIGGRGYAECGYCDRRFVLADPAHSEDERLELAASDPADTPQA